MKTKIIENLKITARYHRLTLYSQEIARKAQPGQFVMVKAGKGADPLLRRPFSIHNLWSEKGQGKEPDGLQILFQVAGQGTSCLASLIEGDELDLIGPLGHGFNLQTRSFSPLFVAGGIGIAPLLFLAEQLKKENNPVQPHLFYGGKREEDILCLEEFRELGFFLHITTEDGSKGARGLITKPLTDYLVNSKSSSTVVQPVLLACGPRALLDKLVELAREYHLPCQISMEERMACGLGACLGCAVKVGNGNLNYGQDNDKYQRVCKEGPVFEL